MIDSFDAYCKLLGRLDGEVRTHEPLARHTTFGIGGSADLFVECESEKDLEYVFQVIDAHNLPFFVLGKGSNLLVSDDGFHGIVITLGSSFRSCKVDDEGHAIVGGACNLSNLVQNAFRKGLGGLEFAVGIPGTVGAAVYGNVGSRVDWISSVIQTVTVYRAGSGFHTYQKDDLEWSYRRSSIAPREIVTEATFALERADETIIRAMMDGNLARRRETQPLKYPNAGSVFKNPHGDSAGRLIEACELKGTRIGGAEISTLHANFIVNIQHASAKDVCSLIKLAQEKVKENFSIDLVPEIKFLGFDEDGE